MSIPRIVLLVVWLLALAAVLMPATGMLFTVLRWLFWTLVVAHAIECVLFLPRLRKAPGSLAGHLGNVMLFGVLHVKTLPRV